MGLDGLYRSQSLQRNLPFFSIYLLWEVELQKRCDQNQKHSKERAIYCPIHCCYLDSASPKYQLFADCAKQLQKRDMPRRNTLMLAANQPAFPLVGEWVEAFWGVFWGKECEQTNWYRVCKGENRTFAASFAPRDLWQYATGTINPAVNPYYWRVYTQECTTTSVIVENLAVGSPGRYFNNCQNIRTEVVR